MITYYCLYPTGTSEPLTAIHDLKIQVPADDSRPNALNLLCRRTCGAVSTQNFMKHEEKQSRATAEQSNNKRFACDHSFKPAETDRARVSSGLVQKMHACGKWQQVRIPAKRNAVTGAQRIHRFGIVSLQ